MNSLRRAADHHLVMEAIYGSCITDPAEDGETEAAPESEGEIQSEETKDKAGRPRRMVQPLH